MRTTIAARLTTTAVARALPSSAHVWLRWPYIITCVRDQVVVYQVLTDAPAPQTGPVLSVSLAKYSSLNNGTGRGANVVHGCDLRDGVLACGIASGLALVMRIDDPIDALETSAPDVTDAAASSNAAASTAVRSAPAISELSGHGKVCAFLRLGAGAKRLYTSSLDKSVRLWSLPDGACLQHVKAGTPVLQIALLPSDDDRTNSSGERVLIGCGDGTVRLWDPACKKANRALSTLRYAHKDYVGELRLTSDACRLLSCSRDGSVQLWQRDAKHGFVPLPDVLPRTGLGGASWRVELTSTGLLGITARGGVQLWRPGASEPLHLGEEAFDVPMAEHSCDSSVLSVAPEALVATKEQAGSATDGGAPEEEKLRVVFVGLRPVGRGAAAHGDIDSTSSGTSQVLELHSATIRIPLEGVGTEPMAAGSAAGATDTAAITSSVGQESGLAGALPAGWDRWRAVAADEGLTIDAMLQQKLVMMESVAASAGRELSEATVRAFMRRSAASSMVK